MLLEVKNLAVSYGNIRAIKNISLNVAAGEIVALLGANGAGKSTTLRTISGLLKPAAGEIYFDGQRIDKTPPHEIVESGLCHSPEGRRVFARLSVDENLSMGAYTAKVDDREHIHELFPVLAERRTQAAGTLSGGEQQMLAIGRALMSRPKLLMLDEPSLGLAPMMVERIFDVLEKINSEGTTILLVEQNAAQALRLASRGYVLEVGEVALEGTGKELSSDERVRKAYLGED